MHFVELYSITLISGMIWQASGLLHQNLPLQKILFGHLDCLDLTCLSRNWVRLQSSKPQCPCLHRAQLKVAPWSGHRPISAIGKEPLTNWHTFFFKKNLFSAFYKRQVLWTSRKSCKDCKARPDWPDYWSFFFFVFTRFTFEDVLALVPSPDRLAFKAPRYSETWSVKPISESKSSARCCAFVVLDNNLMASSSCRDLCVRRVHTWITATCERPHKCDFRQTWLVRLVRSYMKKVIAPKGFIRERKKNR